MAEEDSCGQYPVFSVWSWLSCQRKYWNLAVAGGCFQIFKGKHNTILSGKWESLVQLRFQLNAEKESFGTEWGLDFGGHFDNIICIHKGFFFFLLEDLDFSFFTLFLCKTAFIVLQGDTVSTYEKPRGWTYGTVWKSPVDGLKGQFGKARLHFFKIKNKTGEGGKEWSDQYFLPLCWLFSVNVVFFVWDSLDNVLVRRSPIALTVWLICPLENHSCSFKGPSKSPRCLSCSMHGSQRKSLAVLALRWWCTGCLHQLLVHDCKCFFLKKISPEFAVIHKKPKPADGSTGLLQTGPGSVCLKLHTES